MRIEVEKRGTRADYDEMLSVMNRYQKIVRNPQTKVGGYTKGLILYLIYIVLALAMTLCFYLQERSLFFAVAAGMMVLMLGFAMVLLIRVNKRISGYMNDKGKKIFEMDADGISYSDEGKTYLVKWENVAAVVINRKTVCFIPKEQTGVVIALMTEHADQIIEGLREYGKESLLSDNRSMYGK